MPMAVGVAKALCRTARRCPLSWQLVHLRINEHQTRSGWQPCFGHWIAPMRRIRDHSLKTLQFPCARLSTEAHDQAQQGDIVTEENRNKDDKQEEDAKENSSVRSFEPEEQKVNEPVKSGSSWLTGGFQLGPDMFGGISDRKIADLARRIARLEVEASDIKEEFMTGSGKGGQKINKTASKVRVTHIPSNIQATSQDERERSKNRFIALRTLIDKLEGTSNPKKGDKARDKIRKQKARAKRQHRLKKEGQAQDTESEPAT